MSHKDTFVLSTFVGVEQSLGEGTRQILRAHNVALRVVERRQEVVIELTEPCEMTDELRQKLVEQSNVLGAILHRDERGR